MSAQRKVSFTTTLRGQEVMVDAWLSPPDPDVGIMGETIDDLQLYTQGGDDLDWALSDAEIVHLYEALPPPEGPNYPGPDEE